MTASSLKAVYMSDYRRQFVFSTDTRNRWRWFLFEDGMERIARSARTMRTLDECVAHARRVTGIAASADLWCAEQQAWIGDAAKNS
jgi:hypothetical protein